MNKYDKEAIKEAQSNPAPQPVAKTETVVAKRVTPEKSPDQNTGEQKGTFPAIGEPIDSYEKRYGDLTITEIQLPEVKDWVIGQTYDLTVKVLMTDSRIKQDSKYDDTLRQEIATSNPYIKGEFEIVEINSNGGGEEIEEGSDGGNTEDI